MSEMGNVEQSIVDQALRTRQPIPEKILNAPQLQDELIFYLQAYLDLETERPVGFGLYRIPWHSIIKYAEYYNLSDEQSDKLIYLIRAIDNAMVKKWQTEHPKK
jgi:hypothetical protein